MSIKIMSAVFEHDMPDLTITKGAETRTIKASTAKLVLLALADHANDEGKSAYPSLTTLGNKTALRSRQSIIDTLDALDAHGYISRGEELSDRGTTNYTLYMGVLASATTRPPKNTGLTTREVVQPAKKASLATVPESSFKSSLKQTSGDGKTPSPRDEIRKFAEDKFKSLTKLPIPSRKTEAATLWWTPLREICELGQWNKDDISNLITRALGKMREGKLTVSSPNSILKIARSVYAEFQGARFDDHPETAAEYRARVFGNRQ